jgi:hypothetical protein
MPFEEWIYGKPPKDVEFVRINGNRVIRVELAKMGETPVIFTKDEVEGLMRTDGKPLDANGDPGTRIAKVGDVERNPDTQAPAPAPSLRNPGEKLPTDSQSTGVMRPVQFPKQKPDPQPGANPDEQSDAPQPAGQTAPADASQPGQGKQPAAPPAGASQPN